MQPYSMLLSLTPNRWHLRLMQGPQVLLQAWLPPPAQFWTGKPVKALLESLAIWLDTQLHVVLDADEPADGFSLELTDELGTGLRTLFYDVRVLDRRCPAPHAESPDHPIRRRSRQQQLRHRGGER